MSLKEKEAIIKSEDGFFQVLNNEKRKKVYLKEDVDLAVEELKKEIMDCIEVQPNDKKGIIAFKHCLCLIDEVFE